VRLKLVKHKYTDGDIWRPKEVEDRVMLKHLQGKEYVNDTEAERYVLTGLALMHNVEVIYEG